MTRPDCVILLHGLGRTHRSMSKIGDQLSRQGYTVVNQGYNSRQAAIADLANIAVGSALQTCPDDCPKIHFVTHSMGGILLRQFLSKQKLASLGNVVMLSPPNNGSAVIDRIGNWPVCKQVIGPAGKQLGTGATSVPRRLPPANYPLGIIAGTRSINPLLSRMVEGPNDGKVTVESTKLEGMTDHLVLPVNHTFMMRDKRVLFQISHFLKYRNFDS